MRFRWIRESSRTGCIAAAVTRVMLKEMDIESALLVALPNFAKNPEALSEFGMKSLKRDVERRLKEIRKNPPERIRRQRVRG